MASGTVQGGTTGAKGPETKFRCLIDTKIGSTIVQTLVDTGAGPSCIGEHVMLSNPFVK